MSLHPWTISLTYTIPYAASASHSTIEQFGLGFYSSFLVADRVTVASKSNDSPDQYIFESESDAQGYSIVADPRGNTLGRGTEITLWLRPDAKEYLEHDKLKSLIQRDAEYGASPIYLWTETKSYEPVPKSDAEAGDDDDVKVEDDEDKAPEMREVVSAEWKLINDRAPLWMRDPKEVSDEEYEVSDAPWERKATQNSHGILCDRRTFTKPLSNRPKLRLRGPTSRETRVLHPSVLSCTCPSHFPTTSIRRITLASNRSSCLSAASSLREISARNTCRSISIGSR